MKRDELTEGSLPTMAGQREFCSIPVEGLPIVRKKEEKTILGFLDEEGCLLLG
jgi:hypothetical protein